MKYKWTALALLTAISIGGSLHGFSFENFFSSKPAEAAPSMMKVLIVHNVPGADLEVRGKYKIFDPNKNAFISTRYLGKRNFIQAQAEGLKWGEEFPGVYQIRIVADDKNTTTLIDGREYTGNISVYDIGGTISIVNEVPLEDYVKAVASYHYYDSRFPQELANAIAIAIRSEAWHQHQNHQQKYWDVQADKTGYLGATSAQDNRFAKAVKETKGMILAKDGAPLSLDWNSADISLAEGENLANNGDHAVQILQRAYPQGTLTLIK